MQLCFFFQLMTEKGAGCYRTLRKLICNRNVSLFILFEILFDSSRPFGLQSCKYSQRKLVLQPKTYWLFAGLHSHGTCFVRDAAVSLLVALGGGCNFCSSANYSSLKSYQIQTLPMVLMVLKYLWKGFSVGFLQFENGYKIDYKISHPLVWDNIKRVIMKIFH